MKKRIVILGACLVLLVLVFVAGFAVGARRTFAWMHEGLEGEVQGNLSFLLLELSRVRTGDEKGAIELMESRLDIGVSSFMAQERDWADLSAGLQRTLAKAKAYRTAFPPAQLSDELKRVLNMIPDFTGKPESCRPAMQKVLEMSRQGATEPI